jgi:hypothetical protein
MQLMHICQLRKIIGNLDAYISIYTFPSLSSVLDRHEQGVLREVILHGIRLSPIYVDFTWLLFAYRTVHRAPPPLNRNNTSVVPISVSSQYFHFFQKKKRFAVKYTKTFFCMCSISAEASLKYV